MHLVYISTLKQDFIGESEIAAEPLMKQVVTEGQAVKLEKASVIMTAIGQNQRRVVLQTPLIHGNEFTANIQLNPKHIIDIKSLAQKSALRRFYQESWKKASAENSGITLVKAMPQNLPRTPNMN